MKYTGEHEHDFTAHVLGGPPARPSWMRRPPSRRARWPRAARAAYPGRKPPKRVVAHPAHPYKSLIQNRFTMENAKDAYPPRELPDGSGCIFCRRLASTGSSCAPPEIFSTTVQPLYILLKIGCKHWVELCAAGPRSQPPARSRSLSYKWFDSTCIDTCNPLRAFPLAFMHVTQLYNESL